MLGSLFSNPFLLLLQAIGLVVALTIHECAHAWTADKLGDPTPRIQGRISLNPMKHLDPLGTLALLLTNFGWGKPVEFDPYNLRKPRRDTALIAIAGPVSNLLLALVLSLVARFVPLPDFIGQALIYTLVINVSLAVFNFIPIHPLDGGKVLIGLLPKSYAIEWDAILHRYGILILIFLLFPFGNSQSPVSFIVQPIVSGILQLLLG